MFEQAVSLMKAFFFQPTMTKMLKHGRYLELQVRIPTFLLFLLGKCKLPMRSKGTVTLSLQEGTQNKFN